MSRFGAGGGLTAKDRSAAAWRSSRHCISTDPVVRASRPLSGFALPAPLASTIFMRQTETRKASSAMGIIALASYSLPVRRALGAPGLRETGPLDQRRAGMVSACYLRDTGRQFPYLQSNRTEFRNRVMHNATWPSRGDTADCAEFVCRAILGLYDDLGKKKTELLGIREAEADLEAAKDLIEGREAAVPATRPTFLDLLRRTKIFEEAISDFARTGWWRWPKPHLVYSREQNAG